jgi:hypothetical protein
MKPVAVVAGYFVGNPLGGHVLSILHWLAGLRDLGYEVVFVEDFEWSNLCWNPVTNERTDDPSYGISQLKAHLATLGLHEWCYVDGRGTYHGMEKGELARRCREAAFLLNLWTVTWLDEFEDCGTRIFIDTDPGFTQFAMLPVPATSTRGYASPLDYDHVFSYGTRIGEPDCPIPTHGLTWLPTRPPVSLDLLPARYTPDAKLFTTVMSWVVRAPIVYDGVEYGQKDVEFLRIIDLPSRVGPVFELALAGHAAPREELLAAGWRIADPSLVTATPWTYRDYIAQSRGEFSVAVNLEVRGRTGWFSDRTAAYLASGKPVVVQDTGFSDTLPCGDGLLAFDGLDDAVEAVQRISSDYEHHCRAAREIAEKYFDARTVIGDILQASGVGPWR